MQIEMKKRRSLQKFERPLIGIGYEVDGLMLQDTRRDILDRKLGGNVRRHEPLVGDEIRQQTGGPQPFERAEASSRRMRNTLSS
jgi:hypothetical protein